MLQDLEQKDAQIEELRSELERVKFEFGKYQRKVLEEMSEAMESINTNQARIEQLRHHRKELEDQCVANQTRIEHLQQHRKELEDQCAAYQVQVILFSPHIHLIRR